MKAGKSSGPAKRSKAPAKGKNVEVEASAARRPALKEIFSSFLGHEVRMQETEQIESTFDGTGYLLRETRPVIEQPVFMEFEKKAAAHGMRARFSYPGTFRTMEVSADRVDAHVEKADDGKWYITKISTDFGGEACRWRPPTLEESAAEAKKMRRVMKKGSEAPIAAIPRAIFRKKTPSS